ADAYDEEDGSDERIKQFRMNVAESFGMFNSSISRVIDYYNSRNPEGPVESASITGYAESFLGLTKLMSNELGIPVDKLSNKSSDIFSGLNEGGPYIGCIGAAIEPMDFIPDIHSDRKKGKVRKVGHTAAKGKPVAGSATGPNYLAIGIGVLILCLIVSAILFAITMIPYMAAERKNKQLTQREAELAPVQEVYWNKVYAEEYYKQAAAMDGLVTTPNDNLPRFFTELEEKLPSTVNVVSFIADDDKVTMNMNLESKEAAAMVIEQLRTFDSLMWVDARALTEEINELGGSVVNTTVTCTYAPLPVEPVGEEQPAEAQQGENAGQEVTE
ncbi:MAG: hypothetical protein K6E98_13335, partial [Lachnospiraceae bacterium]|nr:hypothetical protein [Lachnospiraceae bacterium]